MLPKLCQTVLLASMVTLSFFSIAAPKSKLVSFFIKYDDRKPSAEPPGQQSGAGPSSRATTADLFGPFIIWSSSAAGSAEQAAGITVHVTNENTEPDQQTLPMTAVDGAGVITPQQISPTIFGELYTVTPNTTATSSAECSNIQFSPSFGHAQGIPAIQLNDFLSSGESLDLQTLNMALSGQTIHIHLPIIGFPPSGTTIYPLFTVESVTVENRRDFTINAFPLTCHPVNGCALPGTPGAFGGNQPVQGDHSVQIHITGTPDGPTISNVIITDTVLNKTITIMLTDNPYRGIAEPDY